MTASPARIPWVDWTARRISDPVLRLRFLKAAAPMWQPSPAMARLRRVGWVALAILLLAAALLLVMKAKAQGSAVASPAVSSVAPAASVSAAVRIPAATPMQVGASAENAAAQEIWPVESTAAYETYSNGLRIDNRFATVNHARAYRLFASASSRGGEGERRTAPAGIVFHTTESLQAPFEPDHNGQLMKVGEALLDFVKRKKAYNFVVDRFGRVFRVVREQDAAEHAGYSVWSDDRGLYVNLNESFIGVAVETRTQPGQTTPAITAAQIRGIAMLTEMLRYRYAIPAANCVTHAQVSVSPTRMLAGYHMDWASSFPFREVGLPDNYARPLPAVAAFGFECDASFSRTGGYRLWEGATLGAREFAKQAAAAGMSVAAYRKAQHSRYRERLASGPGATPSHEGD